MSVSQNRMTVNPFLPSSLVTNRSRFLFLPMCSTQYSGRFPFRSCLRNAGQFLPCQKLLSQNTATLLPTRKSGLPNSFGYIWYSMPASESAFSILRSKLVNLLLILDMTMLRFFLEKTSCFAGAI